MEQNRSHTIAVAEKLKIKSDLDDTSKFALFVDGVWVLESGGVLWSAAAIQKIGS